MQPQSESGPSLTRRGHEICLNGPGAHEIAIRVAISRGWCVCSVMHYGCHNTDSPPARSHSPVHRQVSKREGCPMSSFARSCMQGCNRNRTTHGWCAWSFGVIGVSKCGAARPCIITFARLAPHGNSPFRVIGVSKEKPARPYIVTFAAIGTLKMPMCKNAFRSSI